MKIWKWLCLLLVVVCSGAHAQTPTITSNGTVAVKPSTCPANFAMGSVNNDGTVSCVASSGGAGPSNGANVITAGQLISTYGVKADATTAADATTTSSSAIVTCPDCKFQTGIHPATAGMLIKLTDSTGAGPGVNTCLDNPLILIGGANNGTISSVDSDTQIHLNSTAGTSSVANACIAYGHDDAPAYNTAWNAGGCFSIIFGVGGKSVMSVPAFQKIAGCPSVAASGTGYTGQRVLGAGITYFIPFFQPSTCALASTGNGCFFNDNLTDIEMVYIWGMGERCTATANGVQLFEVGLATSGFRDAGIGWCGRGGGTTNYGIRIQGATDSFNVGGANYFGSIGFDVNNQLVQVANNFFSCNPFATNSTFCYQTEAGSSVITTNNFMTNGSFNALGTSNHTNDNFSSVNNESQMVIGATGVVNLNSGNYLTAATGAGSSAVSCSGSGGVLNIGMNNKFFGGSSAPVFLGASGCTINEQGTNNTYTVGGGGSTYNNLGTWNSTNLSSTVAFCKVNTASPAACGTWRTGVVAVPTTTTTYTVNTTAVTANSIILLQPTTDNTGIPSAPTCTTPAVTSAVTPTARTAGTSFTFALPSTSGTTCWAYQIVN